MLLIFFPHYKHIQIWMKNIMFEQMNAVNCRSLVVEKFVLIVLLVSHKPDGFWLGNLALSVDFFGTCFIFCQNCLIILI